MGGRFWDIIQTYTHVQFLTSNQEHVAVKKCIALEIGRARSRAVHAEHGRSAEAAVTPAGA